MKDFLVQITITAEVSVEAEDEKEAREIALDEAHMLNGSSVMIDEVEVDRKSTR